MTDKNNIYLEEISESLYNMNADETTPAQRRACAYYEGLHNIMDRKMEEPAPKDKDD